MAPRVGLVTCDETSPGVHPDPEIGALVTALNAMGLITDAPIWSEPRDWAVYDLLVVKSPWDYSLRSKEFLAWFRSVEEVAQIRNHPGVIRWNFDKRYLSDLRGCGIPVPQYGLATTRAEAMTALVSLGSSEVVVKPTVSAGSRDTALFRREDPAILEFVDRITALGKVAMIQRALPSVSRDGEHALVLFNGRYSHAVRKGPILELGGGLLGGRYTEILTPVEADKDEVVLAERCMETVRRLATAWGVPEPAATPLYTRIDIARDDDGSPTVLEAELFEPNYFTMWSDGAADRFGRAVHEQLKSLGD